ncbi:MAG: prepilin-type N-terminal cleavage/methylation domain-containing protein [Synergistaceae bacterium]|jgi:prepilin-type N-terminal cleavage/methylation domain-containing protein|nr:prepilin-type N-terminal cleavage/methylation domain-containing protein [Synergistaceae bacterium]
MSDNHDCVRKRGGGFSLVEVMIAIIIIGALAGIMMVVISRGTDNAEASVIMSDLEAAKNALLAYSMEHRTRTSDRLNEFAAADSSEIVGSLDKYMSSQIHGKAHFGNIDVDDAGGRIRIGFVDFQATQGVFKALDRKTKSIQNDDYDFDEGLHTLWLNVK